MPPLEVLMRFINVFSAAMVAGGQLTVLWVIIPVKRELDLSLSVRIHQAMLGHQIDRFMRPFGILSILSALFILALGLFRLLQISGLSLGVESLGILGTIGVILTSRYGNVRTNRVIEGWSLAGIPKEYPQMRNRWDAIHAVRTLCGVVALSSYLFAGLMGRA